MDNECLRCVKGYAHLRGLCDTCYGYYLNIIHKGQTTWSELIDTGKALSKGPARNKRIRPIEPLPLPLPDKCLHGRQDGECPICEKEQRANISETLARIGRVPGDMPSTKGYYPKIFRLVFDSSHIETSD